MVFEKSRPANIPKPKTWKSQVEEDEIEPPPAKRAETGWDRKKRGSVGEIRETKVTKNGHHCPHKDKARRHVFTPRCITQKHAGYCPECNNIVSYYYGCSEHRVRKENLLAEPIRGFVKQRRSQEVQSQVPTDSNEVQGRDQQDEAQNGQQYGLDQAGNGWEDAGGGRRGFQFRHRGE